MQKTEYDVVFIGGGHNALVCACYLAAAGFKAAIFEARHIVGGAAVTEEICPGFRNSTYSYTVSLLNPKVIRDLRLHAHGLHILERPFSNFLPLSSGDSFRHGGDATTALAELARFSQRDVERLPRYYAMLDRIADVLRQSVLETPPNVGGGWMEFISALRTGKRMSGLNMSERRDMLDLFTKSAGEMLDSWFESEPLKAALGFDSVVGNFGSPYDMGSAYIQLHHCFGEVNGKKGVWGHAVGGMGAITEAMAKEAQLRGVDIFVSSPVAKVNVRYGHASGITLLNGKDVSARVVASNVNPKRLFLQLLEHGDMPEEIVERMERYKCESGTFRMNVALSELPNFTCKSGIHPQPHHSSGIIMAPSLAYMDRAYHDAREFGVSQAPIVEMLIPSTIDNTLAPPGGHVASLFCQQFAFHLPGGVSWDDFRERAADMVINTVNGYAPNFKRSVIARQINSPLDLERTLGLIGGDIFHGKLTLDQMFSARPLLGYADYTTPIQGLFGCGAGWWPGGGVTGAPGHNAARKISAYLSKKRYNEILAMSSYC